MFGFLDFVKSLPAVRKKSHLRGSVSLLAVRTLLNWIIGCERDLRGVPNGTRSAALPDPFRASWLSAIASARRCAGVK